MRKREFFGMDDAAAVRMLASETVCAKQFHEFQPIGGVSAMRSPTSSRQSRAAVP